MEAIRQKVVSVLIALGVVLALFRCGGDDSDEKQHAKIVTSHTDEQEAVTEASPSHDMEVTKVHDDMTMQAAPVMAHDKTLFRKSAEDIAREKEQARLAAIEAEKKAREEAKRVAKAKAKAEAEKLAKLKAIEEEKHAKLKAQEAAKLAQLQQEADKKILLEREALKVNQEKLSVEKIKRENLEMLTSLEEAMKVINEEKAQMQSVKESLSEKIAALEIKLKDEESKSNKIKLAAAAATTLAVQQAVAKSQSKDGKKLQALQAECDKSKKELSKEKELLKAENAKLKEAQKNLLAKIDAWEKKTKSFTAVKGEEFKKLQDENKLLQSKLHDMNATMSKTKENLLAKITEWESKAKEAEAKAQDPEKVKSLADENQLLQSKLQEMNATVSKTKENLLAKITEWESKAKEAEAKAKKLKMATAAAATLAAQQALAKAQAEDGEKLKALQSELDKALAEKKRLLSANSELNTTLASFGEIDGKFKECESKLGDSSAKIDLLKKSNEELNSTVSSVKEELNGKLTACETKSKEAETKEKALQEKLDAALKEVEQMKAQAQALAQEKAQAQALEQQEAQAQEELKRALELNKVEFKYGSSMLLGNSATVLDHVADIILQHPEFSYEIQGHTDAHGNEDYNVKLSTMRAEAVKKYLVEKGVGEDILTAKGFGSSMPIADNSTNEGRLKNRRVVIKIAE